MDFKPGDYVTIKAKTLRPEIAEMLSDKVGIVCDLEDGFGRVVVQFEGTARPSGIFAFDDSQLDIRMVTD